MPAHIRGPSRTALGIAYVFSGALAGAISFGFGQSRNFAVFSQAAHDLTLRRDLYELHAVDYFKYSPTFALLFLPFALAPAWLGATAWGALNFLFAFLGIDRIVEDDAKKRIALLLAWPGIVLATDGDQSNLLVTGAFFLALHALERRRVVGGAAWVALGALVKLFPLLGAVFALFRPIGGRGRALGAVTAALALGLLLPLAVLTPRELLLEYAWWWQLLARDHGNRGWSVMHMLQVSHAGALFGTSNMTVQLTALLVQAVPIFLGVHRGADAAWRRTLGCALLVFTVLFNHRTEYASFVISAAALGVWAACSPAPWLPPAVVRVLIALAMVAPGPFFTRPDDGLTGFFSFIAAHRAFHPLRVLPLLILWLLMNADLLLRLPERARRTQPTAARPALTPFRNDLSLP